MEKSGVQSENCETKTRKIIFNEKKTKEICKTLDRISKDAGAGTPRIVQLFVSGKLKVTNKQKN